VVLDPYLAGRIKAALATDERTNVLDVTVRVRPDTLFLLGSVPSVQLKQAAEAVALELVPPTFKLVNTICVESYAEPADVEALE
jgi:hypothetical protein